MRKLSLELGDGLSQHNASLRITTQKGSGRRIVCRSRVCLSTFISLVIISASIASLVLPTNSGRQSLESAGWNRMRTSDASPYVVNITVDCGQTQGVIPALYVGHYDVDPTRTGIGLNDTAGTTLMKDIDLGFWRVSIGRWEMMDFPSNEDIESREYFRGSTFEDASNASLYCWEHMDQVFRSVSEFNCVPLVCIDYMPRTLANNTIEMPLPRLYTYPNNIRNCPPKNTTVFAEVIKHIVMHYTQGWPSGTGHYYDFEYWEVWNEPDLPMFWNGTADVLFQMYGEIAQSIKSIDTTGNPLNYKVGGLSFAAPGSQGAAGWITPFLKYCKTNNLTVDFLSWHGYPSDYNDLTTAAQISHDELLNFGFGNALNILAEWGIPLDMGSQHWDSNYFAAFTSLILSDLATTDLVDYQTHTCMKDRDVVNSSGGYWGILHKEPTIRKPVYYVFSAFDMLNDTNNGLECTLSSIPKQSGQATIAGCSSDNRAITLIYSNFNNTGKSVNIDFMNLPWKAGSTFDYIRYLIDNETHLEGIDTRSFVANASGAAPSGEVTEFHISFTAEPYTVHVIRIAVIAPIAGDSTILFILSAIAVATTVLAVGIIIRRKRAAKQNLRDNTPR